ncbi:MAG: hypothetical protein IKP03_10960 [Fibrobacter sp.]|nr:hypothetical protein [Fibrobacter sp.]
MDWSKGLSASYYMAIVDPATWRDMEAIQITGGSIERGTDGLMQSASIDCVNFSKDEKYIRVYMGARQSGESVRIPLFTGLSTTPDNDFNGSLNNNTVECFSVLKPAGDVMLPLGWYAQAGIGADVIARKLLEVIPAPVEMDDTAPYLKTSIVADEDETHLSMVQRIVEAINWQIRITGDGRILITPKSTEPVAAFDPVGNDCIEPDMTVTCDWYECPNVFRAVMDDMSAVARDDSEDSPLSTVNRGREIWMQDTSCDLADDESIAEYAARRLREEQQSAITASYDRRFHPDIMPGDVIRLKYPAQGLNGLFRVTSQSIELGYGAKTSEEVANE